jgi:hypothetical protein
MSRQAIRVKTRSSAMGVVAGNAIHNQPQNAQSSPRPFGKQFGVFGGRRIDPEASCTCHWPRECII